MFRVLHHGAKEEETVLSGCAVECVGRAESYMICDEQLGRLQNNGGMVFACQLSVVGWCN